MVKKIRYIHILKKISINKKKKYYLRNVCSEKVNDTCQIDWLQLFTFPTKQVYYLRRVPIM